MKNSEWKDAFKNKLIKFSVRIILLANKFPKTPAGFAIASQIIKSATSIGANFGEAQDASSHKDFIQKLSISLRESKETQYWLELIKQAKLYEESEIDKEIVYCNEIVALLVTSVKSAKAKQR